jgi:hypothetical protein
MPPSGSAILAAASPLMSTRATLQPALLNAAAVAAPSPDAPPVTIAACPSKRMKMVLYFGGW